MLAGLAAQRLQRAESFVKIRREQGLEAAIAVVRGGPSLQVSSEYQTIVHQIRTRSCGCWRCARATSSGTWTSRSSF
jgi:hypothetical protein